MTEKEGAWMTEAKNALTYELDVHEMSFVDLVYRWLSEVKEPQKLHDLLAYVSRVQGVPLEELEERMAILYTDLNYDGRFTCVGENLWGLKHWYPIDSTEDDILALELSEEDEEYGEYGEELEHEEDRMLDDQDPDSHLDDLDDPELDLGEDEDLGLDDELEEEAGY